MYYTSRKIQEQKIRQRDWKELEEVLEAHYKIISDREKLSLDKDEKLDKQDKQIIRELTKYIKEKKSSKN